MKNQPIVEADVAASFQKAVVDVLVEHSMWAIDEYGFDKFAIAGGVASNSALRMAMEEACRKKGIKFYHPSPIFCTDNAAMIGVAGYYEYLAGTRSGLDLNAVPNLKLGETLNERKHTAIVSGSRERQKNAQSGTEAVYGSVWKTSFVLRTQTI